MMDPAAAAADWAGDTIPMPPPRPLILNHHHHQKCLEHAEFFREHDLPQERERGG